MSRIEVSQANLNAPDFDAANYCRALEEGHILYFPVTPFAFPREDQEFLLSQRQSNASYRKNIAYRPLQDRVTGVASGGADAERLREILGRYSRSVTQFLERFLAPYASKWRLDYASFRPIQEKGREVKQKRRNDLLHVDAFPTRPTHGDRILRFFTNINPEEERHWIVGKPFSESIDGWLAAGMPLPLASESLAKSLGRKLKSVAGQLGLPVPSHSRYDHFMLELHDFLKADAAYQQGCEKEHLLFGSGSSWMVFTDLVPHAALSGRFALEQTFIINRATMLLPEKAPVNVLEQLVGCSLTGS